jgi:hypothetical protein
MVRMTQAFYQNAQLFAAVRAGKLSRVRKLVSTSTTPTEEEFTRYVAAAITGGHAEVVDYLLERGAVPPTTALLETVKNDDVAVAQVLVAHGALPTAEVDKLGTAYEAASRERRGRVLAFFNLVAFEVDSQQQLRVATVAGDVDACKSLTNGRSAHCAVNGANAFGWTALHK